MKVSERAVMEVDYIGVDHEALGGTVPMNEWEVTLTVREAEETFEYYTGMALGEPSKADVLHSLVTDYSLADIDTLVHDLGYDILEAQEVLTKLEANNDKLRNLFSVDEISQLAEEFQDY